MSFILDALKKSELERQRQSSPGLVDAGVARPRAGLPLWAVALVVLLAINLVVLLFVLIRGALAPPAATASVSAATAAPRAATAPTSLPSPADHFSPLDSGSTYAPEIPIETPVTSSHRAGTTSTANARSTRTPPHSGPVLTEDDYNAADGVLPTVNEISLTGAQSLPELHLDVHVFATRPADRFVYVNMRKYHEGGTLQEGPTIERIRRDGVILNYQGLRFLLPRE